MAHHYASPRDDYMVRSVVRLPWPIDSGFRWKDTHLALLWPTELRDLPEDETSGPNVHVGTKRKATSGGSKTVTGDSSREGEEPPQHRQQPVGPTIKAIAAKKHVERGKKEPLSSPPSLRCTRAKTSKVLVGTTESPRIQRPSGEFVVVELDSECAHGQEPSTAIAGRCGPSAWCAHGESAALISASRLDGALHRTDNRCGSRGRSSYSRGELGSCPQRPISSGSRRLRWACCGCGGPRS